MSLKPRGQVTKKAHQLTSAMNWFFLCMKQCRSMDHNSPPPPPYLSQLANGGTQEEDGPENILCRGYKAQRHGQVTRSCSTWWVKWENLPLTYNLAPKMLHIVEALNIYPSALLLVQCILKGPKCRRPAAGDHKGASWTAVFELVSLTPVA